MRVAQQSIGILFVGVLPPSWTNLTHVAEQTDGVKWLHVQRDIESAAEQIASRHPDVMLLVPKLPGTVEYDLVHSLKKQQDRTSIVVGCPTSVETQAEYLLLAISLGASVCVSTDTPAEALLRVAGIPVNGSFPSEYNLLQRVDLAQKVRNLLWRTPPYQAVNANMNPLTRRERELLLVASKGHSNQEIGDLLHIQEQTVKNHVSSILRKTHARDRHQAAVNALRNGWLPFP